MSRFDPSDTFTSRDEHLVAIDSRIDRFGYTMQHIICHVPGCEPLTNTIGLVDHGQPEFVVSSVCGQSAAIALSSLAGDVLDGRRFEPSSEFDLLGLRVRLALVDRRHWQTGKFGVWVDYYRSIGNHRRPRALQVLPVPEKWPNEARAMGRAWCERQERLDIPPFTRGNRRTKQPKRRSTEN